MARECHPDAIKESPLCRFNHLGVAPFVLVLRHDEENDATGPSAA